MAAGGWHSMVVKDDGSVWATGENGYGQLGDGSTISKKSYVKVIASNYGVWNKVLHMFANMHTPASGRLILLLSRIWLEIVTYM